MSERTSHERRSSFTSPDEVSAHWMTVFGVEDVDAKASQATDLGGQVMMQPRDVESGRALAVLSDRRA